MPREPTRETVSRSIIPPRPVREVAAEAVRGIDDALDRIAAIGVRLEDNSRLHQARSILYDASESGVLAPVQRGDTLGLRALEVALDFYDISRSLPNDRNRRLREDLTTALKGELEPPETGRGPLQAQSQLVVWAAFCQAGAAPQLPPVGGPSGVPVPDIRLDNGLATYAVEVKRPQVSGNIVPRFLEGVAQVRDAGLAGGVIVDVTDCLRGIPASKHDAVAREHALMLYDLVWTESRSFQPGFDHMMVVGTFARPAWTSDDGPDAAMVNVHFLSSVGVFASHPGNHSARRARWLRSALQRGLLSLGKTSAEDEHA